MPRFRSRLSLGPPLAFAAWRAAAGWGASPSATDRSGGWPRKFKQGVGVAQSRSLDALDNPNASLIEGNDE